MEELLEIREEVNNLISSVLPFLDYLWHNKIDILQDITSLSISNLKDWIFDYYSYIKDNKQYQKLNNRSLAATLYLN